jgi:glycosyltransferase involved in cell wall biosynthesis
MPNTVSAIIIAKDEEKMIPKCLASLAWVDEILVIDTGSTDKTIEIAKKAGAKVIRYATGKTFSDWRSYGLKIATGDWILYIDADERVTEELKNEIMQTINTTYNIRYTCFAIPRRNVVLGQELKHGGWWPDYVKRLYKKESLKGWKGELHEEPIFKGDIGHLINPMMHIKHETFSEMVDKTNNWSEIEAKLMFDANHPPMNIPRFLSAMFREFWDRMIVKKAFLDGKVGIMFATYQVFSRFVSYAKLWEMQINTK